MLLQVWVRGRRKNSPRLALPCRARGSGEGRATLQICFADLFCHFEFVTDFT
jgi:hypothetical protein